MRLLNAAVAAINQTPMDWPGNLRRILQVLEEARRRDAQLVCLPELCLTGYSCEDAFHAPGLQEKALELLAAILPHTVGSVVSVGLPFLFRGGLYNMAAVLVDGRLAGMVGKQHLASDGIHYEPRWFKPWPAGVTSVAQWRGERFPIGDLVFDCGGVRIGFEICEDAWVAGRPGGRLMRRGVDVLFNPSASHFAFDKHDVRRRFVLDGSRAFCVGYLYANLLGNEAGRAIYDGDAMIASCGQMLATGERFSMAEYQVTSATLDIDTIRVQRARIGSFSPTLEPDASGVVECPPIPQASHIVPPDVSVASWETSEHRKEEEFARATTLGLWDYLRKSRAHGFVVSLSGGADSSTVAVLCSLMIHLALEQLGPAGVHQRLAYIPEIETASDAREITRRLLACVYQATRNSSETTRRAAEAVASALGATFHHWDVDSVVQSYCRIVGDALGRPLTWDEDDVALQNIQARARGPAVWMLANLRRSLLLATSNRSEAAVGYATMDGDTCGGLSPIAGIDKAFLRRWLIWMETRGPVGLFPIAELSAVTGQTPTAELRPPAHGQTDEADLMPYELLDAIERAAIRDKMSPLDIYRKMTAAFPEHADGDLRTWITRFFQLWSRNQWKRERYAPSFHLDDENLDPKTWCRFPILSGGYAQELEELTEYPGPKQNGRQAANRRPGGLNADRDGGQSLA